MSVESGAGWIPPAQYPRDYALGALGALSDELLAKVLHDNAARVYRLD